MVGVSSLTVEIYKQHAKYLNTASMVRHNRKPALLKVGDNLVPLYDWVYIDSYKGTY